MGDIGITLGLIGTDTSLITLSGMCFWLRIPCCPSFSALEVTAPSSLCFFSLDT
jgi:hypothetical protein